MRIERRRVHGVAALAAVALLGTGASASAKGRTYEGDIVAVDGHGNTFTVKATKRGEAPEMAFHVKPGGAVYLDGGRVFFAELERGDHVSVGYDTGGTATVVKRAGHAKPVRVEEVFTGTVSAIDAAGHAFSVTQTSKGVVRDMRFHIDPATRLYVGGEEALLVQQLRRGETVSVTYETVSPAVHNVKQLKKHA